ncbi:MAG: hypothetical protein RL427_1810 [Bacteroidota bacterium]|jgi:uncharacterized membrane protein
MNDAHYHLLFNHFPIIGVIFGLGILVFGVVLKNNIVKNVAYVLFIIAALFAAVSMATGEGAEEAVEHMPNIGKHIIHEHEEMAEKLALVSYVLGVISIVGLYTNSKNHSKARLVSLLALVLALIAVFLGKQTGTSGGEIRHTEIRTDAAASNTGALEDKESEED